MKPILLDMNDMSDSREVYESRPHPFFVLFIYLLMVMIVVALLWAAFFKIDIVVKGTGTVSAREDSSIITNTYAGAITKCNIVDGQIVNKGDVLYEVEAKNWDLQLNNYNTQLDQNEDRLVMMEAYLSWLMDNSIDLSGYTDNPYYDEYAARQKIVSLQMDLAQSEFSTQKEAYDAKLASGSTMITYYEEEINKLNQLSVGIRTRTNTFAETDSYYYAKLNNYITQYNNTVSQYDTTLASLQRELDQAKKDLEEAKTDISNADSKISQAEKEINDAKTRIAQAQITRIDIQIVSMPIAMTGSRKITYKCLTNDESTQDGAGVSDSQQDKSEPTPASEEVVKDIPSAVIETTGEGNKADSTSTTDASKDDSNISATDTSKDDSNTSVTDVKKENTSTFTTDASKDDTTSPSTDQGTGEDNSLVDDTSDVKEDTTINEEDTPKQPTIQVIDTSKDEALIVEKQAEISAAKSEKTTAEAQKKAQESLIQTKQDAITAKTLEKKTALSSLETETIAGIEASILQYQQSILSTNGSKVEAQTAQSNIIDQGIQNNRENVIQTEIQTVSTEISNYNQKKQELEAGILEVENGKLNTIVKAPISGVVNLTSELVEGNYLATGTQVMTIIPQEEDGFVVKSYIDNQDIAKIKPAMEVKYEVAAYPSSEYGTMTGIVEFVSADLKANSQDGSAYYVVETSIDNTKLYNKIGEKLDLKLGMYCETKIVVEQKSVLRFLLEKINLVD